MGVAEILFLMVIACCIAGIVALAVLSYCNEREKILERRRSSGFRNSEILHIKHTHSEFD